jgi:hypothetical protein
LLDSENRTILVWSAGENVSAKSANLFSNLWQFPAAVVRENAQKEITEELCRLFSSRVIAQKLQMQPLDEASHTVTFRRITLAPYLIRVKQLPFANDAAKKQIALRAVSKLAVSSATRKIAALALKAVTNPHK